jgi:hypothetical protein
MDDVPFEVAAPAAPTAESPPPTATGPVAAGEPAAAPGANGGGLIETLDDARQFLRPLQGEQVAVMKRMLDVKGTITKSAMAYLLLEQRNGWDPQDILAEMAGWSS